MKVVINACFGGFGLSFDGKRAYLARKGKEAFLYEEERTEGVPYGERDYLRIDDASARARSLFATTVTQDFGSRATKAQIWESGAYWSDYDLERDDPDLVAIVEELGGKASGGCAELRVVEIPDGVAWQIKEYDGNEHVAESHQVWYS